MDEERKQFVQQLTEEEKQSMYEHANGDYRHVEEQYWDAIEVSKFFILEENSGSY